MTDAGVATDRVDSTGRVCDNLGAGFQQACGDSSNSIEAALPGGGPIPILPDRSRSLRTMNRILTRGTDDRHSARSVATRPDVSPHSWAERALVVVATGGLVLLAAACGGSSTSTTTSTGAPGAVVRPPAAPLQGCNYVLNGVVPPGEPLGVQPGFSPFAPDHAAQSAISHIAAYGGTGLVYGFTLSPGVKLFAGPDTGRQSVATIPLSHSILAADPVLWTTGSGAHWLAFFVACAGEHLYWVSVDQIGKADPAAGTEAVRAIAMLEVAAPYTLTGKASILPVKIADGQLIWNTPAGSHALVPPARGQMLGF